MTRTIQGLQWVLFGLYAVVGAVALMLATPTGLRFLGQTDGMVSFLPAKVMGLPWSLPLYFMDDGPVTALAVLGICYGLNIGVGLMLVRGSR
ncbi:hypothetical protein [Brevundimonas sp. TWP2-3-4b2]|uniref:hypothetical protein n=1 Tax=Brevundimonas sp. TWP2-3-4b2 TaxID=2804595 RepID=UPI003CEBBB14